MANTQFGIRHCNATVSDYEKIKNACPCMKCFGTGCDKCDVWNDAKLFLICSTCRFHNGR